MKVCKTCSAEYDEDLSFCPNCGGKLEDKSDKATCAACGATLPDGARFCGKCGAPVGGKPHCSSCGRELDAGDRFCPSCGAAASGGYVEPARKKPSGGGVKGAVNAAKAFEAQNRLIANIIVAVLSVVFLFVALFAPVKVSVSSMAQSASGGSDDDTEITVASYAASQSIYKILGAFGYINLDPDNEKDNKKIREIAEEYKKANAAAESEYNIWLKRHEYATEEEQANKYAELVAKHAADYNVFGYMLAYTTVGAYGIVIGLPSSMNLEAEIADVLDTMRNTAIMALIMATLVSLLQIAIAVFSITALVFSIIGIVNKKRARLYERMGTPLVMSGVGLILTSISPMLAPGGAMLAVCLTAAFAYFVTSATQAFVCDKHPAFVIKRMVVSAVAIVAFFVLCENILTLKMTTIVGSKDSATNSISPLGGAFEALMLFIGLKSIAGVKIEFSALSAAGSIVVMLFGAAVLAALFAWLVRELNKLANKTESEKSFDVVALVGSILLVLFAILSAALGAAGEAPVTSDGVGMHIAFAAYAPVYVAMAFAVAAFVFELLFKPDTPEKSVVADGGI